MGHSTFTLRAAKHLSAQRDRPFAALRVTVEGLISSSVLFFETALSAPLCIFRYPDYFVKNLNRSLQPVCSAFASRSRLLAYTSTSA